MKKNFVILARLFFIITSIILLHQVGVTIFAPEREQIFKFLLPISKPTIWFPVLYMGFSLLYVCSVVIFLWSLGRTKINAPLFSIMVFLTVFYLLLRVRTDFEMHMILAGIVFLICIPLFVLVKKYQEKETLILKIFGVLTVIFYALYLFCITDIFHEWPVEYENWYKQGGLIYAKNGELFTGTISFHQNRCLTGRNYANGVLVDVDVYNCPRSWRFLKLYSNVNLYNQGKLALKKRTTRSSLWSSFGEAYYKNGNISIRREVVRDKNSRKILDQYFNKNGEKMVEIMQKRVGKQKKIICISPNGVEFPFPKNKKTAIKKLSQEYTKVWSDWEYEPQLSCEELLSL